MLNLFKKKVSFPKNGALEDIRTDEEKQKDYRTEELFGAAEVKELTTFEE